jgi:signal transduction histidine kinase
MTRNRIIITATVLVLSVVVFLTFYQYKSSKKQALSSFQEHQILHAQNFADQIESFLWGQSQGMRGLLPVIEGGGSKEIRADIRAYFEEIKGVHVKAVSVYNDTGTIIYSTNEADLGLNKGQEDFFGWAKKSENEGKTFVSSLIINPPENSASHSLNLLLVAPIYRSFNGAKPTLQERRFAGALSFIVDLKEFLLTDVKGDKMDIHQLWIIDSTGKLLFHSHHTEMVSRSISPAEEECSSCHSSFDFAETVLKRKKGTGEYHVRDIPVKIAAFAPVRFANASWFAVVSADYDEVVALTKKNLNERLTLLGIVVLSLIAGSVLIIRNDRLKIRAEEETKRWQEKNIERAHTEEALKESEKQLRYLSSQLLTAQEKERKRIAGELHDELGGALATIKIRLSYIERKLQGDRTELIEACTETLRYLDLVIENVRRFSGDLSPYVLEYFGLSVALRRLLNDFSKSYHIELDLDIIEIDSWFRSEAQIIIYRIIQEVLNNAGKHSRATLFSVAIKRDGDGVSFRLEDNGKGFDKNRTILQDAGGKGLGLAIIDERVRMLGGSLDLWTQEGQGARIIFTIPLSAGENQS